MYIKVQNSGGVIAAFLSELESKGGIKYIGAKFPRAYWAFFENESYDDIIERIENKDKDTLGFYKNKAFVPKYTIFKNDVKIGIALPKMKEKTQFLFIPSTYKGIKQEKENSILRKYYIFDIDENYKIKENARLMFFQ